MASGPRFLRYVWPVLQALRDLGGSAKPADVVDLVVEMLAIGDDERAERMKSGSLRVDNQVHWARQYLVMDGATRTVTVDQALATLVPKWRALKVPPAEVYEVLSGAILPPDVALHVSGEQDAAP